MKNSTLQKVASLKDLDEFVKMFLRSLEKSEKAKVVALSGDLGVGKTTFVQAIAKQLGVSEPVTSPTFTIMKQYETMSDTFPVLVHMDAYRLESESETAPLRLDEIFKTKGILFCIEWAEKISGVLPKDVVFLKLGISEDGIHTIQRESHQ